VLHWYTGPIDDHIIFLKKLSRSFSTLSITQRGLATSDMPLGFGGNLFGAHVPTLPSIP